MNRKEMSYKGFSARIMEAKRLTGDYLHGLPSGSPLDVYYSEEFVNWPENWMKKSFLVPVQPNKGLWFDWTKNSQINTAVLPTVKGCNPITGLQTSGFHLERYEDKCPKHDCNFQGDRYCPECDYKWPFGNYVSHPNTLWWDGFRSDDGSVRQFFFTEEEMRDIATHLIGKENTVPAFGFAFYSPKKPREEQKTRSRETFTLSSSSSGLYKSRVIPDVSTYKTYLTSSSPDMTGYTFVNSTGQLKNTSLENSAGQMKSAFLEHTASERAIKEVSVGAGAKINQDLNPDTYPLDSWKEKPDAVMTIYFVFQQKFEELKVGGMRDLNGKKDGMLAGLPVG